MKNGHVILDTVDSAVLKGNPLGDPSRRTVPIYLPPSYDNARRFPVIFLLSGFTGTGQSFLNRNPWSETIAERCDRLIGEQRLAESIVVMPDCFTRYGGSQYLNSTATGRYEDHVVRELVAHVDGRYRTIPGRRTRAIMGKSSGGYGSLVLGMRHPDVFGSVCCTSGDMYFLYAYLPDFPKAINVFARHGGTAASWLKRWPGLRKRAEFSYFAAINTIAMASCYSPNPKAKLGFDLPMDERTGELRDDVWRRWLAWDPIHMMRRYARALKSLDLLFLDCGTRDDFHLQFGMRIFRERSKALKIPTVVEEFDDTHMNIGYRMDRSFELVSRVFRGGR